MTGSAAHRREGGFTLLEILVALVVLGLLTVGLAQGTRTGLAMWHAQARQLDRVANLDAIERLLRTLLSSMPPPLAARFIGDSTAAQGITGSADRLSFTGELPTGLGTTRRARMTLAVEEGRLMLIWTPDPHEVRAGPAPAPTRTVLVSGVARLALAYWGRLIPNRPPAWQSAWKGGTFPQLIRVRLVFAKGDPRRWPDLIVAAQF
ncbi:MAG: prepilin-type N-terminal cleavage/methylation domain-containing protein [Stellaceae bacterium]